MFFQGRGNVDLAVLDTDKNPGPYSIHICTDTFAISLATDAFSHINKCGPVDVEDYRGTKSQTGTINITFANVEDKLFALGVLGWVTPEGAPGTVTGEQLPDGIVAGDVWYLGGLTRHRNITGLTIDGLTVDTDYTLDAASGRVVFLLDVGSPAPEADYGYTDPASVSMFTAPTNEYAFMYENINKANANDPGSVELYRVRFDPTTNLDFQSDELQIMDLKGSVLANLNKPVDDLEFGQFGRRVL